LPKLRIFLLGYQSHSDQQSSETDFGEPIKLIIKNQFLIAGQSSFDDAICSLGVQFDVSSWLDDHRHSLSIRSEGKYFQKLKCSVLPSYSYLSGWLGWFIKFETHISGSIHES